MTIRHLKIFIAVAESGKMSLAARRLFVTQPSVSQAIRELEEHYQVLLFERLSRKLYITKAGEFFYGYAKQVVAQFDKMEEEMMSNAKEKLRIGATASVCVGVLPQLVRRFQDAYPEVELYSFGGNTVEVEKKIKNMELDVGIIEGKVSGKDLISIPVIEDYMVLAVGKDHPFASREVIHVQELNNQDFAIREKGSGSRALFEDYLKRHQLKVKTVFEENSPTALISAVKMNGCMTVISIRLVEKEVRNGEISVFLQEEKEWDRHFCFVYHKDKYITPAMKAMKRMVKNYDKEKNLKGIHAGYLVNHP